MLKFNNDHIFTGYLKQLLASFNLPKYKVYTKEQQEYAKEAADYNSLRDEVISDPTLSEEEKEKILKPKYDNIIAKYQNIDPEWGWDYKKGLPSELHIISTDRDLEEKEKEENKKLYSHYKHIQYIKDNQLQHCLVSYDKDWFPTYTWEKCKGNINYYYNKKDLNHTKNLKITNNIYDSYMHEYLGDYLRFQRDYNNFNLMSLYNCFSDRICTSLDYSFDITSPESGEKINIIFNATDSDYKIYMLPVRLFKEYTIAIDCSSTVEFCCGIYGKYQDTREKLKEIPKLTYKKFGSMKFSQPILYTELKNLVPKLYSQPELELAQNEIDLKLFIKLPASNTSSIVVLEGNYLNFNDSIYKHFNQVDKAGNNTETAKPYFERKTNHFITNFENYQEGQYFKPITPLQLLRINTRFNYPFADRLIEYLIGNAITDQDELVDNILRVQTVMGYNKESFKTSGSWESKMNPLLYNFFNNNIEQNEEGEIITKDAHNANYCTNDTNHDILGYVDKDMEKYYYGYDLNNEKQTISNIDIYPELYKKEDK